MVIISINDLKGAIDKLSSNAAEDVVDFIETLMSIDKINYLQPMYDDLSINGNDFSYIIKHNYQHVIFAVIGKINDNNEVELTLKSYD